MSHDHDHRNVQRFERPEDRLEWLLLAWSWEGRFATWEDGVRGLARALRGLERIGLIERRTLRQKGHPTRHGFVLTEDGLLTLAALAGHDPGDGLVDPRRLPHLEP